MTPEERGKDLRGALGVAVIVMIVITLALWLA